MFKFNFDVDEASEPSLSTEKIAGTFFETANECPVLSPFGKQTFQQLQSLKQSITNILNFKKLFLDQHQEVYVEYLANLDQVVAGQDDESNRLAQINRTHDVVAGEYEGGLKVWELSIDLARLIYQDPRLSQDLDLTSPAFDELRVLELGCGQSLPTLSLLKLIERSVDPTRPFKVILYLQDFNKKVIEELTFENVNRFMENSRLQLEVHFVYGDWRQIESEGLLPTAYFDLILTTETIYNRANFKPLLNLIRSCMRQEPKSFTLLGAKTYYFGCSGHLDEFLTVARSPPYQLQISPNLLAPFDHMAGSSGSNQVVNSLAKEIIKISL